MKVFVFQRFDLASVSCARRVLCQTEELLRRGHEVYITDFVHEQRQKEIPLVANLSSLGARIIPLNRSVGHFYSNYKKILNSGFTPDIVHLWKSYPDASLLAYFLAKHWKVPLHYDWDDWEKGIAGELTHSCLVGWIAGKWDTLFPRLCHTISVASHFIRDAALQHGVTPERMWDAPVGADVDLFYPQPKNQALFEQLNLTNPVLVYSGQMEVASYAEFTLDVLKLVKEKIPSTSLLVLGGGRKLESIRKKAVAIGVNDSVRFTDYVPGEEIPSYLCLADVALAPFEENDVTRAKSPLKIAEYLAMGLPVVASDIGEARRMTEGAGIAVPCSDHKTMAEAVIQILQNTDLREKMSVTGRKTAETRYNWKSHTDNLEKAYKFAIANYPK